MMTHRAPLIVAACSVLSAAAVHAQHPDIVTKAVEFAVAIEAAARSPVAVQQFVARYGADVGPALVDSLLAGVRAYAARAPDDGEVTILVLRLERARDALARQDDVDAAPPDAAAHVAAVARMLERDPRSALAHHWQARLLVEGPVFELGGLGTWVPWPLRSGETTAWDARGMLEHARQAVALDSANALYREFLAVQLALVDRFTEALEVVRPLGPEDANLRHMLEDFAALGMPDGAVASWREQADLLSTAAMAAADAGSFAYLDWAEVRYRAWMVPAPVGDAEAFYGKRWPGIAFLSSDGASWRTATYGATSDGLVPVADPAGRPGASGGGDVVTVMLRPADDSGMTPETVLLVMEGRRGPWEPPAADVPPEPTVSGMPPAAVPAGAVRVAEGPLSPPLYPIIQEGRLGLIDSLGTVVVAPQFDQIRGVGTNVPHFLSAVGGGSGRDWLVSVLPFFARLSGQTGLVSAEGIFLPVEGIDWEAEPNERRIVRRDGKWGFVDAAGTVVIPARFRTVLPFEQGYAFVREEDKWGVIDRDGHYVVPPTWDDVDGDWGTKRWRQVRIDRRVGVITLAGTTVVPVRFDKLHFSHVGLFGVREGGKWGVMDSSGVLLIPPRLDSISGFTPILFPEPGAPPVLGVREEGRMRYVRFDGSTAFELTCPSGGSCQCDGTRFAGPYAGAQCDGLWGLIDSTGNWRIPPTYRGPVDVFSDTLITFEPKPNGFGSYEQGLAGLRTLDGKVLIEPLTQAWRVVGDGVIIVADKQEEKFSFVDLATGATIAGPFEVGSGWGETFQGQHVRVRVNGMYGMIDRSGQWTLRPAWHLLSPFVGPLAFGQRQGKDCRVVAEYVDRSGRVVFATTLAVKLWISDQCKR